MHGACNWLSFPIFCFLYFSCGYAISHIHIVFAWFSSSIKYDLLDVVVFRKMNSESHNSFAWEFSKTCPLFHFSWYHFTFWSKRFLPFAHATAITISALLCLARYSLIVNILHPPKSCCTASRCSVHNLH